jgi:hypothetical protein
MSTENKKPENILAALEQNKDSLTVLVKECWGRSKMCNTTIAEHFAAFHLSMMGLIRMSEAMAFNFSLSILAEHLLPLLTDEEKEALRNESIINLEK